MSLTVSVRMIVPLALLASVSTAALAETSRPDTRGWIKPGAVAPTPVPGAVPADAAGSVQEWLLPGRTASPTARVDGLLGRTEAALQPTPIAAQPAASAPSVTATGAWGGMAASPAPTASPAPASTATSASPASGPFSLAAPTAADPAASPATGAPTTAPTETAGETIDLMALKYYASQNDIARVAAEIRRIRASHPDWTPPERLFEQQRPSIDEQPLWDLYAKGRLDDIFRKIAELKTRDPAYVPSADLVMKLKVAEGRAAMNAAVLAKDWGRVLQIAEQLPGMLVCPEMQVLWNVGEALARTGQQTQSFDLYRYVLDRCENPKERFATVQKAAQLLPDTAVMDLIRMGRIGANGAGEFDEVVLDKLRTKIGTSIERRAVAVPSDGELAQLQTAATLGGKPDDAMLLGWYYYSRDDYAEAKSWFDRVLRVRFDVKALEGMILSLRNNDEKDAAREIALEYASEDPAIGKLYVEIVASELTDDDPAPVAAATIDLLKGIIEEHRSALGAQSLAWYLYNQKQPAEARDWFAKSVEWERTEEGVLGLAVAENKLGNRRAVTALAQTYGDALPALNAFVATIGPAPGATRRTASASGGSGRSQQRATRGAGGGGGGADPLMVEALELYKEDKYDDVLAKLDARRARRGETRDVTVLRAWALHNSGRYKQANQVFSKLDRDRSTKETREGTFHSWRRMMPPQFR